MVISGRHSNYDFIKCGGFSFFLCAHSKGLMTWHAISTATHFRLRYTRLWEEPTYFPKMCRGYIASCFFQLSDRTPTFLADVYCPCLSLSCFFLSEWENQSFWKRGWLGICKISRGDHPQHHKYTISRYKVCGTTDRCLECNFYARFNPQFSLIRLIALWSTQTTCINPRHSSG